MKNYLIILNLLELLLDIENIEEIVTISFHKIELNQIKISYAKNSSCTKCKDKYISKFCITCMNHYFQVIERPRYYLLF